MGMSVDTKALELVRMGLHNDFSDNYEIEAKCNSFQKDGDSNCLQIIGVAGIGKTHELVKMYDRVNASKIFINSTNASEISVADFIFIDGFNEFSQKSKISIKDFMNKNKKVKYIITSWETISLSINYTEYIMESDINLSAVIDFYNKEDVIDESERRLLESLTYRQLITLLSNVKGKSMRRPVWDRMQKAYENIITKSKFPNKNYKNSWARFKNEFVINNNDFPIIAHDSISEEEASILLKYSVIQTNDKGYFINNIPFLISIKLRKYIKEDNLDWIHPFIKTHGEGIIPILIWYFVQRNKEGGITEILNKYSIDGSKISDKLFRFKFSNSPNISNITIDKVHVFFDLLPHISAQKATDLAIDPNYINFKTHQTFPNNTSKKYSRATNLSQYKKMLIASVMRMQTAINDHENIQISRLINGEKMKGISLCEKLKINIDKISRKIFPGILLIAMFEKWGFKFSNNEEIFKLAEKYFFFKTRSKNNERDIVDFDLKVNNWLEKSYGEKISLRIQRDIDSLLYYTDKSSILESASSAISRLNKKYNSDKYKSTLLRPLISYVYIHFDGVDTLNSFSNNDIREISMADNFGGPISENTKSKIRTSRVIARFIAFMLEGETFSTYGEDETPFLEIFDNGFDEDVASKIKYLNSIIGIPKFLAITKMLDIYENIIIEKDGKTFYPIYFWMDRRPNGYRNTFMTGNNVNAIMKYKNSFNEWWRGDSFPFIPSKGSWNFDPEEFLYFYDKVTKDKALYTSNKNLSNRYYEFYADSVIDVGAGNYDYLDEHMVINHLSKKKFNLREFQKESENAWDEYKNHISKENMVEVNKIEWG